MGLPVFDVSRPIEWIKEAAAFGIKWIAFRLFIISIVITTLPVGLYYGWNFIIDVTMEWVGSRMAGGELPSMGLQLTGLGAWLADQMQLPACLSILMTAAALRFTLKMVRG